MILLAGFSIHVLSPTELPIGIITALFGAPFFIYLLHRRR